MYIPALDDFVRSLARKRWAQIAAKISAIVILTIVSVVALAVFYHAEIIGRVFRNVIDLSDGEMPVSVTSYPSGPEVVSIIGGSGAGLNCSLPSGMDVLFAHESRNQRLRMARQKFRQACVFHDLCYRHGLATYGYSQNDCDRILQSQAHRLCHYTRGGTVTTAECQLETKKVLAGVSVGGFQPYRGQDTSTYFEFDNNPTRSNEFVAGRVIDHPFKAAFSKKYQSDPDQILVSFMVKRDTVSARCENCAEPGVVVLDTSLEEPLRVSDEFSKLLGIKERPEALRKRSLDMREQRAVWLPPGRHHAAPYFLADSRGGHHLVWLSRSRADDTGSCMVFTDARSIFSTTLPQTRVCEKGANPYLQRMFDIDMLSSSPVPMLVPAAADGRSDDAVVVGLTAQVGRSGNLQVCGWTEGRLELEEKSKSRRAGCVRAHVKRKADEVEPVVEQASRIGALQNFPAIRAGQAVYFERDIWVTPSHHLISRFFDWASGRPLSPEGKVLVANVQSGADWSWPRPPISVDAEIKFRIDDSFDPMMPLSATRDDLRFVSITTSASHANIHLTNFRSKPPHQPMQMQSLLGDKPLDFHASWVRRPALVLEPEVDGPAKTQLVLSRSQIISIRRTEERVRFQFAVLERDRDAPDNAGWSYRRGAVCDVDYTLAGHDADTGCGRTFIPDRHMRESPASLIQGAQLLFGRFRDNTLAMALPDACLRQQPIVLNPVDEAGAASFRPDKTSDQAKARAGKATLARKVTCIPLRDAAEIGREMNPKMDLKTLQQSLKTAEGK